MHKTTYLLALTALLSACSTESTTTKLAADEHGCTSAAGYQWSAVQQRCVRLAETGIKLAPTGPDTAQTAYLLFASFDKDGQAEVFLPGQPGRILAKKPGDEAGTWTLDTLTLSQWKGMYSLSGAKSTVLYEGHIVTDEAIATTGEPRKPGPDVPTLLMGSWQRVDDPKEHFVIAGKTLTQYYDGKKGPAQTFAYVPDCGGTACAGHQGPYGCLTTAGQFDIDCQTIGVITDTELVLSVGTTGDTTRYQKRNRPN